MLSESCFWMPFYVDTFQRLLCFALLVFLKSTSCHAVLFPRKKHFPRKNCEASPPSFPFYGICTLIPFPNTAKKRNLFILPLSHGKTADERRGKGRFRGRKEGKRKINASLTSVREIASRAWVVFFKKIIVQVQNLECRQKYLFCFWGA